LFRLQCGKLEKLSGHFGEHEMRKTFKHSTLNWKIARPREKENQHNQRLNVMIHCHERNYHDQEDHHLAVEITLKIQNSQLMMMMILMKEILPAMICCHKRKHHDQGDHHSMLS
jgi:Pyruvate/2-oxoacid:ferredoxin oxidoreductase delta subunit